jgi:hypothetical protein
MEPVCALVYQRKQAPASTQPEVGVSKHKPKPPPSEAALRPRNLTAHAPRNLEAREISTECEALQVDR